MFDEREVEVALAAAPRLGSRFHNIKSIIAAASVTVFSLAFAERVETRLGGWTCDGTPVDIPHTWNAKDGADGSSNVFQDTDNSVAGRAYLRCSKTYRTELKEPVPGKRYFVRFDGASIRAMVAVNGREVGIHRGPFTAFTYEITDFLREHDNALEVVVDNYFDGRQPPIYADYTVCGGLYRPVWLIETDPVCIDPTRYGGPGVEITTDADTGRISVKAYLSGTDDVDYEYAIDGKTVTELKVEKPQLWSPETPHLYDLAVTVKKGTFRDTVHQKIGFKKTEFRDDGFYLNDVKRVLRGVNYHQETEGKGWALTEADIVRDLALMKEMGADSIRTAHYPHSRFCYDRCDEIGLLSWIEIPASGRILDDPVYVKRLHETVRELIAQNRNHPSLLVWSLQNELYSISDGVAMPEGTAEPVIAGLQKLVKSLDQGHPTTAAASYNDKLELNAIPDVYAFNTYPGWYGTSAYEMTPRIDKHLALNKRSIAGIGEYGSGASVHHHENPLADHKRHDSPFHPEELQTSIHRIEYDCIKKHDRLWGAYIWAMFDFASDNRCEGDHKGVNDKGLVTRNRDVKKDAYHFYQTNWTKAPKLHLCSKRMVDVNAARVNVMGFSNVGDVTLYINGKEIGMQKPDSVCTVEWKGVELQEGYNVIELKAGGLADSCTWRWNPVCKEKGNIGK